MEEVKKTIYTNILTNDKLLYDGTDSNLDNGAGNVNKFDGRLTAVKWMSTDASGNKSYERSYAYTYDPMLPQAIFAAASLWLVARCQVARCP